MVSEEYESIAVVVAGVLVAVMVVAVTLALVQTCVAQSLSMSVAFVKVREGRFVGKRGRMEGKGIGRDEPR